MAKKANKQKMQEILTERKIINKVIMNVELTDDKAFRNGSFFDLFTSEMFDINMMLYYLDKTDNIGMLDTLINQLYKCLINESFFYLPQLW